VLLQKHLGCEGWTKVGVLGTNQFEGIRSDTGVDLAVRCSATWLVDYSTATLFLLLRQQSKGLPLTNRQHGRGGHHRMPTGQTSVKTSIRCKSCLLALSQPNLSPPNPQLRMGSDTLALQSYDIIALRLQLMLAPDRNVSMRAG
jgi:hypothetical protein